MEKVTVDVLIENMENNNSTEQNGEDDLTKQDSKNEKQVKALNDTELREQLCDYGVSPGPILPSTRNIYENKLLRLMKQYPSAARKENWVGYSDKETDEGKGRTTEVVLETNNLKVTAEYASGLDNKPNIDMVERQKKLLSPDVEYSLAKIVAELQEILPESKVATHRSHGQRRKVDSSPERNYRQTTGDAPRDEHGYTDANVSLRQSTRKRAINENRSVKQGPEIKSTVVSEGPQEGLIPMRVKIAVFTIFIFILFVYVTMETNPDNPFASFFMGK